MEVTTTDLEWLEEGDENHLESDCFEVIPARDSLPEVLLEEASPC